MKNSKLCFILSTIAILCFLCMGAGKALSSREEDDSYRKPV